MKISSQTNHTRLTREQKEAVGLLSIGTFLEYFDLMLYVHMAVLLNELFFPKTDAHVSNLLAAFAFCSTYLLRPFGALIFGWIGDNIGRKSTVIITTFMMACACFIMANVPTYAQVGIIASLIITICRIVQGMSSMGEFIGAQLYLTEITRPPIRYPVVALTSVASILGGTFALSVASLTTLHGVDWRTAFWFGGGVAIIGFIARSTLKETPDFVNAKERIKHNADRILNKLDLEKNPIYNKKESKKTAFALFLLDCGWPVCFYFAYVFCSNVLKNDFGLTSAQIIHQNFIVSITQLIGMLVLAFLSYKVYPPTIVKIKAYLFVLTALTAPVLMTKIPSVNTILFVQCCIILFACDYVPARPIPYTHFPVFRRFTYTSFSYAISRTITYILISFGLVYLVEYFNYYGLLMVIIPTILCYFYGIYHFDRLEKEVGNQIQKKI